MKVYSAQNVVTRALTGCCNKPALQMSLKHDFTFARSAGIDGENTKHTLLLLLFLRVFYPVDSAPLPVPEVGLAAANEPLLQ